MAPGSWDRFATDYERQLWLERDAIQILLDLTAPRAGDRVLDVATGPAPVLAKLAEREDRPRVVVGLDSSAAMLEHAPELPTGWELCEADATKMPFADASFDVVLASYLLHFLEPDVRVRVLEECARVLRPDGTLGAVTVAPPKTIAGRILYAPIRFVAERSEGRLRGMRPLDPAPELERAGFVVSARERTLRGYPSLIVVAHHKPSVGSL